MGPIIWLEGIIGVGKSSFTEELAKRLNLRALYEPVESNPFLDKFYKDPKKYAFALQMHLLMVRFNMQNLAANEAALGKGCILDRGLPGDRVFCKLQIEAGNIDPEFWQVYENAYNVMSCSLRPPSLLVYLDVDESVAMQRIRHRGRGAEAAVDIGYLHRLRKGYYQLLDEVISRRHAWSTGISILVLPWNAPLEETWGPAIARIAKHCRLPVPDDLKGLDIPVSWTQPFVNPEGAGGPVSALLSC